MALVSTIRLSQLGDALRSRPSSSSGFRPASLDTHKPGPGSTATKYALPPYKETPRSQRTPISQARHFKSRLSSRRRVTAVLEPVVDVLPVLPVLEMDREVVERLAGAEIVQLFTVEGRIVSLIREQPRSAMGCLPCRDSRGSGLATPGERRGRADEGEG